MSEETSEVPIDWMPLLGAHEWALILASLRKTQEDFLPIGPTETLLRLAFLITKLERASPIEMDTGVSVTAPRKTAGNKGGRPGQAT